VQAKAIPSPRVILTPIFEEVDDSTPAQDIHSQARTITQETMLQMIAIGAPTFSARQASTRKYPKEAIATVLNADTGELMEYRHLMADPKYRKIWKPAYGKELGQLAQGLEGIVKGTDTIAFIFKNKVPADGW
jgi:hypothetical protein